MSGWGLWRAFAPATASGPIEDRVHIDRNSSTTLLLDHLANLLHGGHQACAVPPR